MANSKLKKQGTVKSFNFSPKGSYEGLLLQTGSSKTVQINFPQHLAARISAIAPEGAAVEAEVETEAEKGHPAHPVYRLIHLKAGEQKLSADDAEQDEDSSFSGTVKRLNYALHGEVNGAVLNNGDFLHVKPHGARELELQVGMEVEGTGATKPTIDGHVVIEADEVNGIQIEKKPKPKKKAPHK
jgi:hypothetical protein